MRGGGGPGRPIAPVPMATRSMVFVMWTTCEIKLVSSNLFPAVPLQWFVLRLSMAL